MIIAVAYLVALLVGLFFCFATRDKDRRTYIRTVTALGSLPVWIVLAVLIYVWFIFGLDKQPPTLADLQRNFPYKRAALEQLVQMSNEDTDFSRIAPTFVDRTDNAQAIGTGRYISGDPKAGLLENRWNQYRKIYSGNDIRLGIERDEAHDAFIMVDSQGILNRGHATGYVYCAGGPATDSFRYEPCALNQDSGQHKFQSGTGDREGYSFQRLDGQWFAYDQGPS